MQPASIDCFALAEKANMMANALAMASATRDNVGSQRRVDFGGANQAKAR